MNAETYDLIEHPTFTFSVTHVERITPPENGWSRIDGLLADGKGERTDQDLAMHWIPLHEPLLVTNLQWLWQTPNGSVWIANKDDPFVDPDKRLLLRGMGPDSFTEQTLLLFGEELQAHFHTYVMQYTDPGRT